jgi:hypothetical protein
VLSNLGLWRLVDEEVSEVFVIKEVTLVDSWLWLTVEEDFWGKLEVTFNLHSRSWILSWRDRNSVSITLADFPTDFSGWFCL